MHIANALFATQFFNQAQIYPHSCKITKNSFLLEVDVNNSTHIVEFGFNNILRPLSNNKLLLKEINNGISISMKCIDCNSFHYNSYAISINSISSFKHNEFISPFIKSIKLRYFDETLICIPINQIIQIFKHNSINQEFISFKKPLSELPIQDSIFMQSFIKKIRLIT